jgi:hypothetical protein
MVSTLFYGLSDYSCGNLRSIPAPQIDGNRHKLPGIEQVFRFKLRDGPGREVWPDDTGGKLGRDDLAGFGPD